MEPTKESTGVPYTRTCAVTQCASATAWYSDARVNVATIPTVHGVHVLFTAISSSTSKARDAGRGPHEVETTSVHATFVHRHCNHGHHSSFTAVDEEHKRP